MPELIRSLEGIKSYQVYQRNNKNFAEIPFRGSLNAPLDGVLKARIFRDQVLFRDWEECGKISGGLFSGKIPNLPTGGEYCIELQFPDGTIQRIESILVGDLWIMGGQSNMDGFGKLLHLEKPDSKVHCFYLDDHWDIAKDPLVSLNTAVDPVHWGVKPERRERAILHEKHFRTLGAGLGVRFGKEMYCHTGIPIGLIPNSHNGSTMKSWDPNLKFERGKSLYGSLLRRVKLLGGKVAGCLWYQGESDTIKGRAEEFENRFIEFVVNLRKDVKQPDLPFIYAQIATYQVKPDEAPDWNLIQNIQLQVEGRIPNSAMAVSIDLSTDDRVHLTAESLRILGYRMAHLARMLRFREFGLTRGPRLIKMDLSDDRTELTLHFEEVNGSLAKVSPVLGFSVESEGPVPISGSHVKDQDVILKFLRPLGERASLKYGAGLNPTVNLRDKVGMPLPAFGPVEIQ